MKKIKTTIRETECPRCDGDGGWIVRGSSMGIFDIPINQSVKCKKCNGTGIIKLKTEEFIEEKKEEEDTSTGTTRM